MATPAHRELRERLINHELVERVMQNDCNVLKLKMITGVKIRVAFPTYFTNHYLQKWRFAEEWFLTLVPDVFEFHELTGDGPLTTPQFPSFIPSGFDKENIYASAGFWDWETYNALPYYDKLITFQYIIKYAQDHWTKRVNFPSKVLIDDLKKFAKEDDNRYMLKGSYKLRRGIPEGLNILKHFIPYETFGEIPQAKQMAVGPYLYTSIRRLIRHNLKLKEKYPQTKKLQDINRDNVFKHFVKAYKAYKFVHPGLYRAMIKRMPLEGVLWDPYPGLGEKLLGAWACSLPYRFPADYEYAADLLKMGEYLRMDIDVGDGGDFWIYDNNFRKIGYSLDYLHDNLDKGKAIFYVPRAREVDFYKDYPNMKKFTGMVDYGINVDGGWWTQR